MTGLPGLVEMRSLNKSGLSIITLVFTDKTDVYFARQLVTERLIEIATRMPAGITPVLGPLSTGLGEVYQYTLDHPDDGQRELTPASWPSGASCRTGWCAALALHSGCGRNQLAGGLCAAVQVLAKPTACCTTT